MGQINQSADNRVKGVGLGLRYPFAQDLLDRDAEAVSVIKWLEIHPENYIQRGGRYSRMLAACRERWPIVTHGLTMSLGGPDSLSNEYMKSLNTLLKNVNTPWHSDHLCFSVVDGVAADDLLPLPMNDSVVNHLAERIRQAQDSLSCPLAVENVSAYVLPNPTTLSEGDFVRSVIDEAGCYLMLDVNNLWVNSMNHGFDAKKELEKMPLDRVIQIHVAGPLMHDEGFLIDTHSTPVRPEVLDLLDFTLQRTGQVPVLLEWDDDIPPLDDLLAELQKLDTFINELPKPIRYNA